MAGDIVDYKEEVEKLRADNENLEAENAGLKGKAKFYQTKGTKAAQLAADLRRENKALKEKVEGLIVDA